ncbi:hypothetical protein D3C81_1476930 [compost metagenome]
MERFRRVALRGVVGVEGGFPVHRVEVGDLHGVAGGLQALDAEVAQRAVEGRRFWVRVNE